MAERIGGAQAEIESHLAELRRAATAGGDGTPLLIAEAQHQSLGRLQHRIAHTHGAGLLAIRAEVSAFVAAAQAVGQQVRSTSATAQSAEVALHAASAAAGRETRDLAHDFYDRKIFDPYLRFTSAEDEEAYRRRETERQKYIAEQLALGTPEGNLSASKAMTEQMDDAEAHGAGGSPEFRARQDRLKASEGKLESALSQAGAAAKKPEQAIAPEVDRLLDSLDGVPPSPSLSREKTAILGATGVILADQSQQGHGLPDKPTPNPAVRWRG
ncbi:MAG: hypothetical protein Q7U20_07850 [Caulobacter sp.]|nr:hypothetical protein [Caulobacter sp.]